MFYHWSIGLQPVALLLLLPNTDRLQQVEDIVGGYTWQLKKINIIYRFHKLVFHRGDSSLECFNWANENYGLWQSDLVRYNTEGKQFLSLLNLRRRDNERWAVHVPWLSHGWPSLSFLAIATFFTSGQSMNIHWLPLYCTCFVIINIIPCIKCPRGFNFWEKYPEGYFHGYKWIKRKRKKHPCHQYFKQG